MSLVSLPLRSTQTGADETPPHSRSSPGVHSSREDSGPELDPSSQTTTAFTVSRHGRPQPRRDAAPRCPGPTLLGPHSGHWGVLRAAQSRGAGAGHGAPPRTPSSNCESLARPPRFTAAVLTNCLWQPAPGPTPGPPLCGEPPRSGHTRVQTASVGLDTARGRCAVCRWKCAGSGTVFSSVR